MPYRIEYIENEGGLIVSWTGKIAADEVIQSYRDRFAPLERLKKLRYIITDYTEMEVFELKPEDIKIIAAISNHAAKNNRDLFAVAIMPKDFAFGLARMFQSYADDDTTGWHTLVTRTRKEAEEWLYGALSPDLKFRNP
ncbi:MAG: hypothetical protein FP816_08455 [Desulfobacteraceae bacterium]|nr:hypothetical protein [Desulfobacteraceae bacterium]MBU4001535.1 hypothetical protein [Pseudomonadota bacterium]MBU4054083.1 hypothetical protein [Pseudomonadota bacterium]